MTQFVERYGAPLRIISDRGTAFTSEKFKKFCKQHGIKHTLNSSRHPRANGMVERVNRTILPMMMMSIGPAEETEWDRHIKKIERDVNTSVNKTTGKAPFEALYGYMPRFKDGYIRELTEENETYQPPPELQNTMRTQIEKEQLKYKKEHDKHHCQGLEYNLGDIVFVKMNPIATGESMKLQARYRGPFVITQILPGDTYGITKLIGGDDLKQRTTAHVSQLKIWKSASIETEESEDENGIPEEKFEDEFSNGNVNDLKEEQQIDESDTDVDGTFKEDRPIHDKEGDRQKRVRKLPRRFYDYEL